MISVKKLQIKFYFFTLLVLALQIVFKPYNYLMMIGLFFIFTISIFSIETRQAFLKFKYINLFLIIFLFFLLFISVAKDNDFSLALRFYTILILILLAYFVPLDSSLIKGFIFISLIQAIIVFSFYIYLSLFHNLDSYIPLREYFKDNQLGDIFTYNGQRWYVQIKGNAVLPIAFMLSFYYLKGFFGKLLSLLFAISIICAGNFAFLLVILLVIVHRFFIILRPHVFFLIFLFFIFLSICFPDHVINLYESKLESSIPIRFESISLLLDFNDLNEALLGKGLGFQLFHMGEYREYTGDTYFEFQAIYFLSMLGILPFLIYFSILMLLTFHFMRYKYSRIIYIIYLLFASINPYFLDTLHILVIILLISLNKLSNKNEYNIHHSHI